MFNPTVTNVKALKSKVRKLGLTAATKAMAPISYRTARKYATSDIGGPPVTIARRGPKVAK